MEFFKTNKIYQKTLNQINNMQQIDEKKYQFKIVKIEYYKNGDLLAEIETKNEIEKSFFTYSSFSKYFKNIDEFNTEIKTFKTKTFFHFFNI